MIREDFELGIIIGLCIPERPVRKKVPIAYSYNGVVLPKLPELTGYPYIVVYKFLYWTNLAYFENAEHFLNDQGNWRVGDQSYEVDELANGYSFNEESNEWEKDESRIADVQARDVFWANFDILNEDLTVRLSKSDPVPVYE